VSCLILPRLINNLPIQVVDTIKIKIPAELRLADNANNQPQAIDMLLGAKIFFELMGQGKIINANSGPVIQETKLGWIISGRVSVTDSKYTESTNANISLSLNEISCCNLDEQVAKFWRSKTILNEQICTLLEKACQTYFNHTVSRSKQGRFIVQLPFKNNFGQLEDSY